MYICDDKCPMFNGYSICARVVTAAEDKCKPNLTAIASAGIPSGSGRKGGKPKHKRNQSSVPIELDLYAHVRFKAHKPSLVLSRRNDNAC